MDDPVRFDCWEDYNAELMSFVRSHACDAIVTLVIGKDGKTHSMIQDNTGKSAVAMLKYLRRAAVAYAKLIKEDGKEDTCTNSRRGEATSIHKKRKGKPTQA